MTAPAPVTQAAATVENVWASLSTLEKWSLGVALGALLVNFVLGWKLVVLAGVVVAGVSYAIRVAHAKLTAVEAVVVSDIKKL